MNAKYIGVLVHTGILGLFLSISEAIEVDIRVSDAWIPEAPPVATTMAGYLRLDNKSDNTVTLVDVSSPSFAAVELHRSEVVEGMARMVHQERLDVPAHETLLLEPGSYHLMLMKPVDPLNEGDTIQLRLHFDHGQTLYVTALVKKRLP